MASINDVAKKANVAKSTVSLVINNKANVSQKTREKVERAMRELNYAPNQLASNLSKRKSNLIGIIMPDIMHPFFATYIKYVEKLLGDRGYQTLITGTVGRESIELQYLDLLKRRAMDGIIVGVHSLDLDEYRDIQAPIVSLDRYINNKIPVVSSNHQQAAELTAELIKKNGCKKVVQFVGTAKIALAANDYAIYCKEILNKAGISVEFVEIGFNTFDINGYEQAAQRLFDNYADFDAVVGVDMVAISVLKIAVERKIAVPEKLKIIAYDGTYITRIAQQMITAIVQPIEQLAYESVETLLALIDSEDIPKRNIVLDTKIQYGKTTL